MSTRIFLAHAATAQPGTSSLFPFLHALRCLRALAYRKPSKRNQLQPAVEVEISTFCCAALDIWQTIGEHAVCAADAFVIASPRLHGSVRAKSGQRGCRRGAERWVSEAGAVDFHRPLLVPSFEHDQFESTCSHGHGASRLDRVSMTCRRPLRTSHWSSLKSRA